MTKPVCLILGAGLGNGQALVNQFVDEGYYAIAVSRNPQKLSQAIKDQSHVGFYDVDLTDTKALSEFLSEILETHGVIDTLIYNAGNAVFGNVHQTDLNSFQQAWQLNTFACLQTIQALLPSMQKAKKGNVIIVGASASLRGQANFLAFASAKSAQRSIAESIAKEVGKDGIHVAYLIVDGVIDMPLTRTFFPDKDDSFFLQPAHIAESIFYISQQHPSAWSFQVDLRPYGETW